MSDHSSTPGPARAAAGVLAPGHLGELTQVVPFEMVDAVLAETGRAERRRRLLPARVVVYLLLAAGLFERCGWSLVWGKLTGALTGCARPAASALYYARKRLGPAPMRTLFELLAGPGPSAARWRGLTVLAVDGTFIDAPDTDANRAAFGIWAKGTPQQAGYPHVRLVTLVATGSRALIAAAFGPHSLGELGYATDLFAQLRAGQLVLADRAFDAADCYRRIARTGADALIRLSDCRRPRWIGRLADGTGLFISGGVKLRVIEAEIAITTPEGTRTAHYRLATTLLDHRAFPAEELMRLYHQRWEIESSYAEIKSTLLRGRVLRATDPEGVAQELWSLLCLYQILRIAIDDAVTGTDLTPLQASFKLALEVARDQLIRAEGIITTGKIDLRGRIGRQLLAQPVPDRRIRIAPRASKRSWGRYPARADTSHHTHPATLQITVYEP